MTSAAEANRDLPKRLPEMLSKSINDSVVKHLHSFPRYEKILPDGANSTVIGATAQAITFEIPAGVYNLGKMVLRYTRYAAGAELKAPWERQDVTPISIIELTRKSNDFQIAKISFADHLSKVMTKIKTPIEELGTPDRECVYRCNSLSTANLTGEGTDTGTVNYTEVKYAIAHASRLPSKSKTIHLNKMGDSVFSTDEMVYYQYPLKLTITFAPLSSWGWIATGVADGTTGAAALAQSINLTAIDLLVAKETDPDISAERKRLVLEGGFQMLVPVINANTADGPIATETSVKVDLGAYMGDRILRIIAIPEISGGGVNMVYNSRNDNAGLIPQYQTYFNGDSIQGHTIRCTAADNSDWLRIRDYLKGTSYQDEDMYRLNWFIMDDFSGIDQDTKTPFRKENIVAGKKLSGEALQYRIETENIQAIRWYIYVIGQRRLRIAPDEKGGWGWV